jgi:hypothetical protein
MPSERGSISGVSNIPSSGVADNFHNQSLKEAFEPLILRLIPDISGYVSIKTKADKASDIVDLAKKQWSNFFPGNIFEFFFLDVHFAKQYNADQRFGKVFSLFTILGHSCSLPSDYLAWLHTQHCKGEKRSAFEKFLVHLCLEF